MPINLDFSSGNDAADFLRDYPELADAVSDARDEMQESAHALGF